MPGQSTNWHERTLSEHWLYTHLASFFVGLNI